MPPTSPLTADRPPVPPGRVRGPALWLALAAGMIVLFFVRLTYGVFHDLADGMTGMVPERVFEEITGSLTAVPILIGGVWLARRAPMGRGRVGRSVAILLGGSVALSMAHTAAMVSLRALLTPGFGLARYPLDLHPSRFAFEMANDVLPFAVFFVGFHLAESMLARRDRERRAAELERTLLESELRNLRLQLQPHFLFNALNTVAEAIYDDPARADALLGHLAELLRTSLRTTHAQEVPLREEIVLLERYLALMRARFDDRLTVTLDIAPGAESVLVPSMILQPLVENAIRHGGVAEAGRGRVTVAVARRGSTRERVELRVHDDGPGTRAASLPADGSGGTGLSATARRLALLYGDDHRLELGNAPEGGFVVRIEFPARTSVDATAVRPDAPVVATDAAPEREAPPSPTLARPARP